MRTVGALGLVVFLFSSVALADVTVGVVPSTQKVRPADKPKVAASATLRAARNEFEAFQIVLSGGTAATTVNGVTLSKPLSGTSGSIPAADVVVYVERYYDVAVPSNDEGAAGAWPDPLVPDVDTYVGEKRNAFPLTVPPNETRVVWVDVLVPASQAPGDYAGELQIDGASGKLGTVPITLHVGTFSLPSTATPQSTFGLGFNGPSLAHCPATPYPYCGDPTGEKSNALRALYLVAGLEHRITLNATEFQPPQNGGNDRVLYEKYVLPLVNGTGKTRLAGAKVTTVQLDAAPSEYSAWITYGKSKGMFERLFIYPVDEPNGSSSQWTTFKNDADALHALDPAAASQITSTITEAKKFAADEKVDIFSPVLDEMYGRPGSGFPGDQRATYDAWQKAKAGRRVWMYQSCDQHGCGSCKTPSPGVDYVGWPQRVIDSTGVQDRAFEWWSFLENTQGELYFAADYQLAGAWDKDGQCAFSGSGDGTFFYPGKPSVIGGTKDVPVESIRLKLIREGMEDYEYLVQAAAIDPNKARQIALALFPKAYECNQPPEKLEAARAELFAMLDKPGSPTGDGGVGVDGSTNDDGGTNPAAGSDGGCSCEVGPRTSSGSASLLAIAFVTWACAWRRKAGSPRRARR